MTYLDGIRSSYDTVADSYAGMVRASEPWETAMLTAFADLVRRNVTAERVLDAGCGPGRVTQRLQSLGLPAFGVDLSPGMVDVARRDFPDLEFAVGSMTALDLADGSLGGVLSWWSIVHLPREVLPVVLGEFYRVLVPGGQLLVGFHVGDTETHKDSGYGGHPMSVDVYRWQPDQVAALAAKAGFVAKAHVLLDPEDRPGACLFLEKPVAVS